MSPLRSAILNALGTAPEAAFPKTFAWGCCTSPTQVEGDTVNEWAGVVAADGTTAEDGPRHGDAWRDDFALLAALHQNAYRFGLDWGRLQHGPEAPLEDRAVAWYGDLLDDLARRGIEPHVTLFHFACPRWLAERGGWLNPRTPRLFADFAGRVAKAFPTVRFYVTVNEPAAYAFFAYVMAEFPPGRRHRLDLAIRAMRRMQEGHALAYDAIKAIGTGAALGIAKHFKRFTAHRAWHPLDRLSARVAVSAFDRWGLDSFVHHRGRRVCDFVGVNFYGRMRMRGLDGVCPLAGYSRETLERFGAGDCDDMWEQHPEYLEHCLVDVAERTGLPLYITENGVATDREELRLRFLMEHLRSCVAALARGVDLRGFFYWSLLDNWEWSVGLTKRFGLAAVDFGDPARPRSIRPTGRLYGEIARRNGWSAEDLAGLLEASPSCTDV